MAETSDPIYLPMLPIVREHLIGECVLVFIALVIVVLRVVARIQ